MAYKKCPRCELNWIKDDEDLCDVCKAELKIGGMSLIEDDEDILDTTQDTFVLAWRKRRTQAKE